MLAGEWFPVMAAVLIVALVLWALVHPNIPWYKYEG